jgi:hypothetical protein
VKGSYRSVDWWHGTHCCWWVALKSELVPLTEILGAFGEAVFPFLAVEDVEVGLMTMAVICRGLPIH